jgi:hypothetical protein
MLSFVVNSVVLLIVVNAEYQHAVCCCYAKCSNSKCRHPECLGTITKTYI